MSGDLKKLKRSELIEIIYRLKKSEQDLQEQNEALQQQLQARELKLEKAGSIAEAAMALTEVFEEAQAAADVYLQEIKAKHAETERECELLIKAAEKQAEQIIREANMHQDLIYDRCRASKAELNRVQQVLQQLNADEFPWEKDTKDVEE